MLTTRDYEIIEFLREFKVASTETIAELMFPSLSACQKRLKVLCDNKKINRIRDNINRQYIYFVSRPKQLRHSLLVTDFYRELHKRVDDVVNFKLEPVLGDIRPDAVFGYRLNKKGYIGLLEVEISNKGFNTVKYDKFYREDCGKYFPAQPILFIVSDTVKLFRANFMVHIFNTSLSDFCLDNIIRTSSWVSA